MSTCVHHRFEDQVERSPRSVALVLGERQVTRDELNQGANRIAGHLRSMGVRRNDLVAVSCELGPELIMALLGVLKAGAAYVPLDPAYPSERLRLVLQQAGCSLLLTQRHLGLEMVPSTATRYVETLLEEGSGVPRVNPPREGSLEDFVYCIFTSGSTGTPKGALNLHRGFANLCAWYSGREACGGPDARTMLVSSIGFDLSQKDIFEPLISGGLLVFGGRHVGDLEGIEAAVRRHRPTRINCAPSAFEAMKGLLLCESLEMVVLGGEPIRARLAEEITERGSGLMNSYGPTECSDVAMYHVGFTRGWKTLPLGKPIPNVDIHLLDDDKNAIEGAGVGELFIGGVGVGAGYVGRPDLTAEKFVEDRHGGGRRWLYGTGDVVRRADDGTLWYVGREDDQVKIRGNRVELGEIEAVLAGHEAVENVAVVTCEDGNGDKHLVVFLVVRVGAAPISAESLSDYLGHRLPPFMVPAAWRFRGSLPLNASGKVDRCVLRELASQGPPSARSSFADAVGSTEALLARIWGKALGRQDVGVEEDFFALGGDSLSALQISMALREHGLPGPSLETLYSARTIRALAKLQETPPPGQRASLLPGGADAGGGYDFVPSLSQEDDLRKPSKPFTFLKSFFHGFRIVGRLDTKLFAGALAITLARHEALRTSFHRSPTGDLIGRVAASASCDVLFSEGGRGDLASEGAQVRALLRSAPFDLSAPPLLKCVLIRRSEQNVSCGLLLHHSIADAWSMSVLTRDLGDAYTRLESGATAYFPPSPRFSDFARTEREGAARGDFAANQRFWRARLADMPMRLAVPLARSTRPQEFTCRADAVRFELDQEWVAAIRGLCRDRGVTPYMVLLTSIFLLLHRHGGEEDLYVRSPASCRGGEALANVIGPFASAMVIRLLVRRGVAAQELLGNVRDAVLEAQENLILPPSLFGECFSRSDDPAYGSRFQVIYNHHNYPPHPTRWGRLKLFGFPDALAHTKGDLVLHTRSVGPRLWCALAFYEEILTRGDASRLARELRGIVGELTGKRVRGT